jgi:predicted alpha/beta-hydrolase family hydrolase
MAESERLIVLAPGAGATTSSPFMKRLASALAKLGVVEAFDYPYQLAGRRSPDRREMLVKAHHEALATARAKHPGRGAALVGKSMGSRMGCHVAVESEDPPKALVCFGYPLAGRGPERRGVLLELKTPILFIQGTRDPLCPLEDLARVREQMSAPSELFVVEDGDHSLKARQRSLEARGETDASVEAAMDGAVAAFLERFC